MSELDQVFEEYRARVFGPNSEYPIDAYTHFGAGWEAAMKEAHAIADRTRQSLTNGGAINAAKSIMIAIQLKAKSP